MGYIAQLYRPLDSISRQVTKLQSYIASAEARLLPCSTARRMCRSGPSARPLRRRLRPGRLRACSRSPMAADRVLDDLSFDIAAGTAVGIVRPDRRRQDDDDETCSRGFL